MYIFNICMCTCLYICIYIYIHVYLSSSEVRKLHDEFHWCFLTLPDQRILGEKNTEYQHYTRTADVWIFISVHIVCNHTFNHAFVTWFSQWVLTKTLQTLAVYVYGIVCRMYGSIDTHVYMYNILQYALLVCMHVCYEYIYIYVCIYICLQMYVCIFICIYIYIYIYMYI